MESEVKIGPFGASFNGPDATRLFHAITLRSALKMHKVGLKVNRHMTTTKLFGLASAYSGQKYKRGEFDRAMQDLTVWINTMRSAIPITIEDGYKDSAPISVNGEMII